MLILRWLISLWHDFSQKSAFIKAFTVSLKYILQKKLPIIAKPYSLDLGLTGGSDGKESPCKAGDPGLIPAGSGRSAGEENGYPFQYACLENAMDRGACWAIVIGISKSQTWLND